MKWPFVICVALAGACTDHGTGKLAKIRDEVCQCKTVACAEAALGQLPKDTKQPSRKAQGIAREMLDCLAELYERIDRPWIRTRLLARNTGGRFCRNAVTPSAKSLLASSCI